MKALLIIVALAILIGIMLLPYHPVSACPTATPSATATPSPTATQPPKLGPMQWYVPLMRSPALVVLVQPTATPGERVCSHPSDPTCKDD